MISSRKRSSHRGSDKKSTLHLVAKRQNRSAKFHCPYTSIPTKKMHASSRNLSLPSIPSILVIIIVYLTIAAHSIPVQHTSQTSDPTPSQDASQSSNDSSDGGGSGLDGTPGSPDKMEVMNWILAAISIVIVVELIFWLFKCVNMVRRGSSGNEENGTSNNNNGFPNRAFDTSNGPDDEYLPPYDGLSLPKYCEAMEMSNIVIPNDGNGELRSSPLTEDENSTAIVTGQEDNERVEGSGNDAVEISRINNQTSTVVVEMNQVTTMVEDGAEQSSPTDNDGSRTQET